MRIRGLPTLACLAAIAVAGTAAPQSVEGWTAQELAKLVASDGEGGDQFGAALSVDGDTLLVAADQLNTSLTGGVYVLVENGTTGGFDEVAFLTPSDPSPVNSFGACVSLSGDTAVIGAPGPVNSPGAAYVFDRNQGGPDLWGQVAKLEPSDGLDFDEFGTSVSVSGTTLVVGATQDDHGEGTGSAFGDGSAYVFERVLGVWTEAQKLVASDAVPSFVVLGDRFGEAVSIDGDTLAVGAMRADLGPFLKAGAAYVFERDPQSSAWSETAKLIPLEPETGGFFGSSASLRGDLLALGARRQDQQGAAYVFQRVANVWTELAKLAASDGANGDEFGRSLSLWADTLVVGAPSKDTGGLFSAGAAYTFERNQGGPDAWGETAQLVASDADGGDDFGQSVVSSASGPLVGSPGDGTGISTVGEVEGLAFDPTTGSWYGVDEEQDKLISIDPVSGFGTTISNVTFGGGHTNVRGLAFDPGSLTLYASDGWGDLLILDTTTGWSTTVGPMGITGIDSLAFDTSAGVLYGVHGTYQALVTIDPVTAVAWAPILRFSDVEGLAFDPVANVLYGCDHATNQLVVIDTATGIGTAVGPLGYNRVEALALDPATGTLYGADNQVRELITIDTATGAGATVGSLGTNPDITGLAFDPGLGLIYGANLNGNSLVSIDPATAVKTQIGGFGNRPIESLAFDPSSGTLYAAEVAPDRLLTLSTATGSATVVGPLGYGYVTGLTYDAGTGTLFGADQELNRLVTIDTASGAATALSEPLGFGNIQGLTYDTDAGRLIASDETSDQLLSIDPLTNQATVVGPLGTNQVQGLALDPATDTLLGANGGTDELIDIDPTSGATAVVGVFSGTFSIGSVYAFAVGFTPRTYCTAGVSASGCQAAVAASGSPSASAPSGFDLQAFGVEGAKNGQFYYGVNGTQAAPWGNGTSFQCVTPPLVRGGLLGATGTAGACDGFFGQDLNALWFAKPGKNPGAGNFVRAQLWYRDPQNPSNQTTSLSDAVEIYVAP